MKFLRRRGGGKLRRSCPIRGTWVEIATLGIVSVAAMSCPIRGTWVEMLAKLKATEEWQVVPHTGHVG